MWSLRKRWATVFLGISLILVAGCGDGGKSTAQAPPVVVVGEVPAGALANGSGIGSYDISPSSSVPGQLMVAVYGLEGQELGLLTVEASQDAPLTFFFVPTGAVGYEIGSMRVMGYGASGGPTDSVRADIRVSDPAMRGGEIWLDIVASGDPAGSWPQSGYLSAPIFRNPAFQPAVGGNVYDDRAYLIALAPFMEGGEPVMGEAEDIFAWLEALEIDRGRGSPTMDLLLGVLVDRDLHSALMAEEVVVVEQGVARAALTPAEICVEEHGRPDCDSECARDRPSDRPWAADWFALMKSDCLACATLNLRVLRALDACIARRQKAVEDDAWCAANYTHCWAGTRAVAAEDRQTCQCACDQATCAEACRAIAELQGYQPSNLSELDARCSDSDQSCQCFFDPADYCSKTFPDTTCGGGSALDGVAGAYRCETASCGDGAWTTECAAKPALIEVCDASSSEGASACGEGFECVDCACRPCETSVVCGDGRISTTCPDLVEECDPLAVPTGCAPGLVCEFCGCVEEPTGIDPPVNNVYPSDYPDVCARAMDCAAVVTPDEYAMIYEVLGPGGSCWESVGTDAAVCTQNCTDALAEWGDEC